MGGVLGFKEMPIALPCDQAVNVLRVNCQICFYFEPNIEQDRDGTARSRARRAAIASQPHTVLMQLRSTRPSLLRPKTY